MSATTAAPHPRIAELLAELERSRRELLETVSALAPAQRDAVPTDGAWSVAQILEHLCMVEDGGGRLISKVIKQAQELGAYESDADSILGSLDQFDLRNPTSRLEAPEQVQPTNGLTVAQAIERLQAVRERLVTALLAASGLALSVASYPHPFCGPLNGYQWTLLIALHERRHVAQIRRLAQPVA